MKKHFLNSKTIANEIILSCARNSECPNISSFEILPKMVEWDRHHCPMYVYDYTNGMNLHHVQPQKWKAVPHSYTMNLNAVCKNKKQQQNKKTHKAQGPDKCMINIF